MNIKDFLIKALPIAVLAILLILELIGIIRLFLIFALVTCILIAVLDHYMKNLNLTQKIRQFFGRP